MLTQQREATAWSDAPTPHTRSVPQPESRCAASGSAIAATSSDASTRDEYVAAVLCLDRRVLRSWLWRATRDAQSLDDLSQEVYERLLRVPLNTIWHIDSLQGYARGIAQHVALDWIRRRRSSPIEYREDLDELEAAAREQDPEVTATHLQELRLLLEEVQRLPARCRAILTLVKIFGHSAREAAQQMGIEECTVKRQLQIAAERCQLALMRKQSRPGLLLLSRLLRR